MNPWFCSTLDGAPRSTSGTTAHTDLGSAWISDGTTITLQFGDGLLFGNAGCNGYIAGYPTTMSTGPTNDISVGQMTDTGQICDEEIVNQEQVYLTSLQSASSYTINGNSLRLTKADGPLTFNATATSP